MAFSLVTGGSTKYGLGLRVYLFGVVGGGGELLQDRELPAVMAALLLFDIAIVMFMILTLIM